VIFSAALEDARKILSGFSAPLPEINIFISAKPPSGGFAFCREIAPPFVFPPVKSKCCLSRKKCISQNVNAL